MQIIQISRTLAFSRYITWHIFNAILLILCNNKHNDLSKTISNLNSESQYWEIYMLRLNNQQQSVFEQALIDAFPSCNSQDSAAAHFLPVLQREPHRATLPQSKRAGISR